MLVAPSFVSRCNFHCFMFSSASLSSGRSTYTHNKEIADASFVFASRGFTSKSYMQCVRSNGSRKESFGWRTSLGKESADDKQTVPSFSDAKPLDSRKQEAILALFSRIQSSIANEKSPQKTRKVAKTKLEDTSKRKQVKGVSMGIELKEPRESTLSESSPRNNLSTKAAELPKRDTETSRPISKFVKRSPIPAERKETVDIVITQSFSGEANKLLDLRTLENMKIVELKELAKSKGLKGYSKLRKDELIDCLKGLSY